jgi:hypothetical protein
MFTAVNGVGAAGLSRTELSIWEFPFSRGGGTVSRGGIVPYMIMCEGDAPERYSGQYCVHLYAFVSYRSLSPQFQFSLYADTLDLYIGSKILLTSVGDP